MEEYMIDFTTSKSYKVITIESVVTQDIVDNIYKDLCELNNVEISVGSIQLSNTGYNMYTSDQNDMFNSLELTCLSHISRIFKLLSRLSPHYGSHTYASFGFM